LISTIVYKFNISSCIKHSKVCRC